MDIKPIVMTFIYFLILIGVLFYLISIGATNEGSYLSVVLITIALIIVINDLRNKIKDY